MTALKPIVPVLSLVMTPVALTAYVMAAWRLGSDLNWFSQFFIEKGLMSRWQVWLALAVAIQMTTQRLNRNFAEDTDPAAGS